MHLLYTRWFNKAIRDNGVFDDALQIAAQHGRNTDGLFDEPMLLLRNQGQVLGAERPGDMVLVTGHEEGGRLIADRVEVIEGDLDAMPDAPAVFYGELIRRTESVLRVRDAAGEEKIVDVPGDAVVEIPSIEGDNDVNQLKHHLEIQRMSKSKGNVVDPDELVAEYGADVVRAYLMFGFDWQKGGPWNDEQISGVVRWVNDVWEIGTSDAPTGDGDPDANRALERAVHQTIYRVEEGLETFSFNTAIAALMGLRNTLKAALREGNVGEGAWRDALCNLLLMMAPFTPHVVEELWTRQGGEYSIHNQPFPEYDAEKAKEDAVELVVMVQGKPRGTIMVAADISKDDAIATALESDIAKRYLNGDEPKKVIFIPGRSGNPEPKVNIVI
jgi:leucyl-tRNA synthetase